MARFSKWIDSMLVKDDEKEMVDMSKNNDLKPVSESINFDDKLKFLMETTAQKKFVESTTDEQMKAKAEEANELMGVRRDLERKSVLQKINRHDKVQSAVYKEKGTKYIPYYDGLKEEVALEDENKTLDTELDEILQQKLDVFKEKGQKVTNEMRAKIEKQDENNNKREKEHADRITALRNRVNQHDNKQKKENAKYVTFEELSLEDTREENDNIDITLKHNEDGSLVIDGFKLKPGVNDEKYKQYIKDQEAKDKKQSEAKKRIQNDLLKESIA